LIKENLKWAPSQPLKTGVEITYKWIVKQLNNLNQHVKNLQEELNPLLQNSDFSFKVSFKDVGDKKEKSIKNSV